MKKLILGLTLGLLAFAIKPDFASADCTQLYGGGVSCPPSFNFTINKLVMSPGKGGGNFVENLSVNDPKYSAGQTVQYELIVTNTGNQTIPQLFVKDTFPQYVTYVSGAGNYDSNSKTLSFTVSNLGPGDNQSYILNAKVADAKSMPVDKSVICTTNKTIATDTNGATDSDSSQLCIQKTVTQVLPAATLKTTPPTGPEMLPLAMLLPGALWGLTLRKKSTRMSDALKGGNK